MIGWYVRVRCQAVTFAKRLRDRQKGLTMIEYGVAAAFLVLFLVGAAMIAGPKLVTWIGTTMDNIIAGNGRQH